LKRTEALLTEANFSMSDEAKPSTQVTATTDDLQEQQSHLDQELQEVRCIYCFVSSISSFHVDALTQKAMRDVPQL